MTGEIAIKILLASLTQVLLWVGSTILVGVLVAYGNKWFYKSTGTASRKVCLVSGVLGVPLHELGHAFFCVIFGHKITEMKLFLPSAPNGCLGYVNHTYNPKNFYQRLGNFFIGVGPILFISGVIALLEWLLVPYLFTLASGIRSALIADAHYGLNVFYGILIFLKHFFSLESLLSWRWWLFIVLSCTICLHMNLSKPDIKGSASGLVFTIIVFAAIPLIAALIDLGDLSAMNAVNNAMVIGGVYYIGVLIMAIFCVYLLALVAFLISRIVHAFHRKRAK